MHIIKKHIPILVIIIMIATIGLVFWKTYNKGDTINPTTLNTSDVESELKDYTFKQHDNITFDCTTDNITIGEVYDTVDVTIFSDGINMSDEAFERDANELFDNLYANDENHICPKPEYDEEDKCYCYSDDDFLFDYYKTGSTLWVDYREIGDDGREYDLDYQNIVKRIKADKLDPEESYNVGGEEYSLKDAVNFTDKRLDELSKYLHVYSPILTDIAVAYIPEKDQYLYLLRYSTTIDGKPTDDSGFLDDEEDTFLRGNYLNVELRSRDRVSLIDNTANFHIDKRGNIAEIIPLSQAEEIASNTLAPESKYVCTNCRLKYVCIIKGSDYDKCTATYKPMWVFTLEEEQSKEYDFRGDNFGKNNLYIDAVTGDAFIFDYNQNLIIREVDSYK